MEGNQPPKSGANPWNIIGWILLVLLLIYLYGAVNSEMRRQEIQNGISSGMPSYSEPSIKHFVKQISLECGEYKMKATIENVGSYPLKFGKGYFQAYDRLGKVVYSGDSYFSPNDIPPGSMASVDVFFKGIAYEKCALVSVQDSDGNRATISN